MKRSARQRKITQKLADSKEQEESFKKDDMEEEANVVIKHEIQEEVLSTADALKIKLECIAEVLDNCQVNPRSEYSIDELKILDGPSLLKLFTIRETFLDGVVKFRCQLVPTECQQVYSGHDERDCKNITMAHLLYHVDIIASKMTRNLLMRKFKPCTRHHVKEEPDYSDYNDIVEPIAKLPKLIETSVGENVISKSLVISGVANDDLCESDHLLDANDPKEALLSAVSLRRNVGTSATAKKNGVRTRLGRRKVVQEKKKLLHQKHQEQLRKRFIKQPKVVVRDLLKSPPISSSTSKNSGRGKISPSSSPDISTSEDDDSSSESGTTDSEDESNKKPAVLGKPWRGRSLMSSLRNRRRQPRKVAFKKTLPQKRLKASWKSTISDEADKSEPDLSEKMQDKVPSRPLNTSLISSLKSRSLPMRHVPSILRRTTQKLHIAQNMLPSKAQSSVSMLNNPSKSDGDIIDVVTSSPSSSLPSHINLVSSNNNDGDSSSSESDIASDSSCWSDNEVSKKAAKLRKKSPRKQSLTIKEDESSETEDIKRAMHGIMNDHCYTTTGDMHKMLDKRKVGGFIKLMTPTELNAKNHISVKVKPIIKITAHSQTPATDQYRLKGPSSRRIEPAADPKIKAKALRLISELRHRKPKEVMVCTERVVNDGQSSFIVQDFYTCEICGKRFTAPNSLYGHYRGHAGIKPFKCGICGQTFTRSHSLSYHAMIHTNSARFECSYCGRKFRHPTHYKEHLHRHTGEEPYRCSDCPRRFKTRNTFRRHMISKHNKTVTPMGSLPYNSRIVKTMEV